MTADRNKILTIIQEHKSGLPVGITSICSANENVIKASMENAKKLNKILLIESTSNQVDQFGGYTGMTPSNFRGFVLQIAEKVGFPLDSLYLGGDHLGPNVWRNESTKSAMEKAKEQIKAYVNAGYTKIHLDATMKCADDGDENLPLDPHIIAERAAVLCKAAEEELAVRKEKLELPVYVIGSDVPPPGGAKEESNNIRITKAEAVEETIFYTQKAFYGFGLEDAWSRVIAIVVQPGVEFGDKEIFDYQREKAIELKKKIETKNNLVYEAHSTDFQLKSSLRQMVEDHFAILKVGPWMTFAFREAVLALELIEKELLGLKKTKNLSDISNVIEYNMNKNPKYWYKYYQGKEPEEKRFQRKYSFSDRIRYYWSESEVKNSLSKLIQNLSEEEIPLTLISQFLPESFELIRSDKVKNTPDNLITNRIMTVLEKYNYATMGENL
jgi:D-tagatose-1,6-bisphosphate aldolase subunit GatZ/KbaZ